MTALPDDPEQVHPRPQLVREGWQDLCGAWDFAHDDAGVGLSERWQARPDVFERTILVPYPPESELSGIGDTGYHPVVWYQRHVDPGPLPPGHRLLLHFGAVDYHARVWADGERVAEHTGGQTPFSCDITDQASGGGPVRIVVRAEDQPTDVGQPRGKQDWRAEPHGIWYHRTTGIWQPVWTEVVPETHVTELQWTPDLDAATVTAEVVLNHEPRAPLTLAVALRMGEETLATCERTITERSSVVTIDVPLLRHQQERNRLLWSPQNPQLVEADVHLSDGRGTSDEVASYLGLRSVSVEGGDFVLNGHSRYLRMVLAQGYWPESHLAAPDAGALKREVELVKRLGFNGVRVHQKVEDPRFLYWCDRLGLLVWGEMANAFSYDPGTAERFTREWLEAVRRDRSHPCIVTWVPMNESWGVEEIATDPAQRAFATGLHHLTKAIDPTRPVLSNDGWEHTESDIWTIHDYAPRGRVLHQRYATREAVDRTLDGRVPAGRRTRLPGATERGQPVMLTEFGGVRFDPEGRSEGWGYSRVSTPDALVERVTELVGAVVAGPVLRGFCWTQLTDTEQEQNGLLTEAREPKAPFAELRRAIGQPPGATAVPGRVADTVQRVRAKVADNRARTLAHNAMVVRRGRG